MVEVTEVQLPGVGIRYEFSTKAGGHVGVVAHRSGRREIYMGTRDDPDTFQAVIDLNDDESRTLAELLGGSRITREVSKLRQALEGLALDWLPIDPDSPYAGRTIADTAARTRTGVSIVAVMRGEEAHPAPRPEFRLEANDTVVVVGRPHSIETLTRILHEG